MATVAMETAEMSNIFIMLQILWNLILLLTRMYRWDFWLWNFQNGCRCHGNSKNVKFSKMLSMYWKFTERCTAMHICAFTVKQFWNGCRLVAIGGRVTSAIACNGNSSYVTRSTMSGDILLFLCFFVIIIILPPFFVRQVFWSKMEPILMIIHYKEEHKISGCSRV